MKRQLIVLILAHSFSLASISEESPTPQTGALADEIEFASLGPNCANNVPRLIELTSRPDFTQVLDARRQAVFLTHLAMCLADRGQMEAALDYANRAATADPGSFGAQGIRMTLGMMAGKPADSVDAVEALSKMRPGIIREMSSGFADQLIKDAGSFDGTGELQLRVYDTLERVAWAPPPPYSDDQLRLGHARLLIEHDRLEEAGRKLAPVTDPEYIVAIRSDRTFDVLRKDATFEAQLEFAAAVQQSLVRARTLMEENPRMAAAIRNYVSLLEDAIRFDEVLAVTESALDRHEEDPAAFDDAKGNLNWLLNQRSYALYSVGRFEEARALIGHSMNLQGVGQPSDGNVVNYASELVWEGRAQESLSLLLKVGNASAFLKAWVEAIRSCAAAQLGEPATSKISLDYLRAHESDDAAALSTALLCANELDEAAALMVRRLGSRELRQQALAVLQIRPLTRFDEMPFRKLVHDRMQVLRERDDVRAAVESVGRIEVVPVVVTKVF